MGSILVAGSTGYLGGHIVSELQKRQLTFKAIARNKSKLEKLGLAPEQIIEAQVTDSQMLKGCCNGADTVISALGITRQKDDLSYMDVDYQANKNLLDEAIKSGVKKFIYVSVLHGESLEHLQVCEAKERFVKELQGAGIAYCIIRPSGFYSDMKEIYDMAQKGRVYLFGDGTTKANPIHGEDLARLCVDAVAQSRNNIEIGGKEVLSHREIAEIAFDVLGKRPRITLVPDWVRRLTLTISSLFMSKAAFGKTEFFLTVMAMDMTGDPYGEHSLREFFSQLKKA